MSQGRRVVHLRPGCSDGDALHVPKQGNHTQVNPPKLYLEKTVQQWMEDRGEAQLGVKYILEALPNGYTMWQRPRPGKPSHIDKYLYGHPSHKVFDSPNRFYPHFRHLMDNNGSSIGCPCTVCAGSAGILPGSSSNSVRSGSSNPASSRPRTPKVSNPSFSSSMPVRALPAIGSSTLAAFQRPPALAVQAKGRPKLVGAGVNSSHVDDEGTPDIYRNLIDKLRRHVDIDEIIEQPLSPDWLAEKEVLPGILQNLKEQDQWLPRIGEIVLYLRDLPASVEVMQHEQTGEYQLYDEEAEVFLGPPRWQAGLVGEVPTTELPSIADLHRSDTGAGVIYSGVRIEPLPSLDALDKSLSKRHKYVPLRQVRPFALWRELLKQVPQEEWHVTVINALTVSSTMSLFGQYRFRGSWPEAFIYCYGIHFGSEVFTIGDTIRLLPNASKSQARCTEVMVIKTIRLRLSGLDLASSNDYDGGRPYNSEVLIYGSAYSSDPSSINKEHLSEDNTEPPRAGAAYGEWYPLHPASKELVLPLWRVAGRLYEQDAVSFWLNSDPDDRPTLDAGREGILEARAFARQHDHRIESGSSWYWGDNRADALGLQTINGLEVIKHDQERDIRALRKNIKIIDHAKASAATKPTATPSGKDLRRFMAPGTALSIFPTEAVDELSTSDNAVRTGSSSAGSRKKRPYIVSLSDDDDEIRRNTMVMDDDVPGSKKAKVAVVIKAN
ncbi:hypothetical protein HBI25_165440 [Parastagonospora nodorum]|nr:hypothetical protein HBI25_165440 [Parastagonospora nodorum]